MEAVFMPKTEKDYFEGYLVGYNQDLSKECVITFNATAANIRVKSAEAIKKLKSAGFNWTVLNRSRRVKAFTPNYEKVSIIPSTREYVFVYFYFLERGDAESFVRLSKLSEVNECAIVNIDMIRKNPNRTFKEFLIKEYFDYERIKLILDLHFKN